MLVALDTLTMTKATVELDIGEMMGLIDWHWEMFRHIPKERYGQMTMAGHTLEVTAMKHKQRANELHNLLDEVWPK